MVYIYTGATHSFDLRPPWFITLGVSYSYIPLVIFPILSSLTANRGHLWTARIMLAFSCLGSRLQLVISPEIELCVFI